MDLTISKDLVYMCGGKYGFTNVPGNVHTGCQLILLEVNRR